ncbi:MAG: type I restriction-modification system subunit M [Anaerolineales bacterium]|nr:type I restriction-modification system subunit M [Anaerolineales bacterium]
MAIKKSELYSSLWKSCDELRGGMDASQYKDYVLVLLFVKYVSDKYAGQPDALIEVPEGGSFADMVALKGDVEIGDKINKIIARLVSGTSLSANEMPDFNNADKLGKDKEMVDRLSNLIAIFEVPGLDFSRNRADGDDILGDAYEYLMRNFATESGKSKGQFYTPAEVSRIMAKVIGIQHAKRQDQTIYDPTCGSGSLLLKAADEARTGVTIYGQEMDNATVTLAKMNMYLHDNPAAEIWKDNTLSSPYFKEKDGSLKTFDFAVANPPFSSKAWSNGFDPANDIYQRFVDGIPPKKNGDYAFLLHILRSLKSTGKGAIILPHGVLFRGNAEAEIRRNIVRRGYIKGIIGLPPNLFYGTGIPACIIILDKENAANRAGIFMIDASKGFKKDGNKNRLRHQDIHKIVDVFNRQIELPRYSRMVSLTEIEANDFNLNIPRYIDSADPEDLHDIEAHLLGGIPNRDIDDLARFWEVFPSLKQELFEPIEREGYSQLKVDAAQIKPVIFAHPEFVAYANTVCTLFARWQATNTPRLKAIDAGTRPKELIEEISEDLLQVFADTVLIDKHDVYQHLMSYWVETMQDDVYLVVVDGWLGANKLRLLVAQNGQKITEKADFEVGKRKYKADLIPPSLIVARYFAAEQQTIEALETARDDITRQMEELDEEHGSEEGLLFEAKNEKGNYTKKDVTTRLKAIKDEPDYADEYQVLSDYLALMDKESALKKHTKEAQEALDAMVIAKYPALSENEVKTLVVEDKWLATLDDAVQSELDRVSQVLTGRIKQLAERYGEPLPQLAEVVEALSHKVNAHLGKLGFTW